MQPSRTCRRTAAACTAWPAAQCRSGAPPWTRPSACARPCRRPAPVCGSTPRLPLLRRRHRCPRRQRRLGHARGRAPCQSRGFRRWAARRGRQSERRRRRASRPHCRAGGLLRSKSMAGVCEGRDLAEHTAGSSRQVRCEPGMLHRPHSGHTRAPGAAPPPPPPPQRSLERQPPPPSATAPAVRHSLPAASPRAFQLSISTPRPRPRGASFHAGLFGSASGRPAGAPAASDASPQRASRRCGGAPSRSSSRQLRPPMVVSKRDAAPMPPTRLAPPRRPCESERCAVLLRQVPVAPAAPAAAGRPPSCWVWRGAGGRRAGEA